MHVFDRDGVFVIKQGVCKSSRSYTLALRSRVRTEAAMRSLTAGKIKYVVLFCDPLMCKCVHIANHNISLCGCTDAPVTTDKMYRSLAMLFFLNGTRVRVRKANKVLHSRNCSVPTFEEICLMQKDLFDYPTTECASMVENTCACARVRDLTVNVTDFETTAFAIVHQAGVVAIFLQVTLDDDLLEMISAPNTRVNL